MKKLSAWTRVGATFCDAKSIRNVKHRRRSVSTVMNQPLPERTSISMSETESERISTSAKKIVSERTEIGQFCPNSKRPRDERANRNSNSASFKYNEHRTRDKTSVSETKNNLFEETHADKKCIHRYSTVNVGSTVPNNNIQFPRNSEANKCNRISKDITNPYSDIPGPRNLPLIGGLYNHLPGGKFYGLPSYDKLNLLHQTYGDLVLETPFPGLQILHLLNPDHVAQVLRTEGKWPRRPGAEIIRLYLKLYNENMQGMGTSSDAVWYKLRSSSSPHVLRPSAVASYFNMQADVTQDFVQWIARRKDKEGFIDDFVPELQAFGLESIGVICFNKRLGAFGSETENKESRALIAAVSTSLQEIAKDLGKIPWYRLFHTPRFRKFKKCMDEFKRQTLIYISEVETRLANNQRFTDISSDVSMDLVTCLLTKTDLSREEVYAVISDIFFGGVDTTTFMILFSLYLLAKHPETQMRLHEEICRQTVTNTRLTQHDMEAMPYLRSVTKEALRLYPVFPRNSRFTGKDLVLSGYHVPKGTMALMHTGWLARQERYFKDADKFIPERWMRDSSYSHHPFAYMPFGFGARSCLGRRISEQKARLFLLKVLERYHVETTVDSLQMKKNIVSINQPDQPIRFKFTER